MPCEPFFGTARSNRDPLSHPVPSAACPGASPTGEPAADRGHRQRDPLPADLSGSRRHFSRCGRPRDQRVLHGLMGPLRILQTYPKGDVFTGAAIQFRELAQGLRDRGHHVVVATRPSSEWPEWASQTGTPHYGLPMRHALDLGSVRGLIRSGSTRSRWPTLTRAWPGRSWSGPALVVPLPPLLEGNPEPVRHEATGLLVPPRDPSALAEAVLRLIADPVLARSLAQAGRKLVLEGFSTRAKLDRLETLYRTLAKGRSDARQMPRSERLV